MSAKELVERFIELEDSNGSTALSNQLKELDLEDSNLADDFWTVIDGYINDFII